MIKFLHAADLHLDSPFSGLSPERAAQRRKEQRALLSELVELSNAHGCELMLLAGDLFDSDNAYPDTLEALARAFAGCSAQIVIAPGNHDCAADGSAYKTERWPENVHIFTEPQIRAIAFPELGCRVYGAAFTAPEARDLLAGFTCERDGAVNLMVLHADALNAQSPYNFVSKSEIAGSGLDYLALGHIHAASGLLREGRTAYAWPGCAMGRGFDELGEKGVYIGSVGDGACELEFHPLHGRKYEILSVPAGEDPLASVTAALPQQTQDDIYRILLTGEAEPVPLQALYRALEERFFSLTLRDETTPKVDLWAAAGEDTLRGIFLRELRQQFDAAQTPEEKQCIADAARLGLAAMDGREAPEL